MTDYSFMKAGRGLHNQPELNIVDETYIASLLTLFTSNAIINASEYSTICGRNGITKEDVKYALIFEVFEFLKNPNIISDLQEIERDIETEMDNDDDVIGANDMGLSTFYIKLSIGGGGFFHKRKKDTP